MARLFDDGNSEYLTHAGAVVTAAPLTLAGWFNSDNIDINQTVIAVGNTTDTDFFNLILRGAVANDYVALGVWDGSNYREPNTTSGYSANTWHHACGVEATSSDRRVYIDGGSKGTNLLEESPAGVDNAAIGHLLYNNDADTDYFSGLIAEAAVWNIALTDAEVAILAKGFSPLFVHPQNLVAYWPLVRGLNDKVGGYDVTAVSGNSGPVVSAHPRIIYPTAPYIIHAVAAVGAVAPTATLYGPLMGCLSGPV